MIDLKRTALLLIGFQNDYFAPDGILHGVIEESSRVTGVLENTLSLLRQQGHAFAMVVNTPILFTPDYSELKDPVGILKTIVEVGAFKQGSPGAEVIAAMDEFKDLITYVPGKRGLNAFAETGLADILRQQDIEHVVLAGTVTSLCIDSSARSALDEGLKVTILSDCTSSRTPFEQQFYCEQIFPLYASVTTSADLTAAPASSG